MVALDKTDKSEKLENAPCSVLIVDDEAVILTMLRGILKTSYTVYSASSGEAALRLAVSNKPDIILLDVVMPDMNGFEVLSELKKSDETKDIPVILLTGLNDVENEEAGLLAGAVDYIRKPFHDVIVRARIQTHIDIASRLRSKDSAAIMLKTRQEVRRVPFRELVYVDVSGHWLNFHLSAGENIPIYGTLKEYEDTLISDGRFARCHKSFIVNMDFVAAVEIRDEVRDVIMKNGERLPVSKGYLGFKKQYAKWVSG